MSNIILSFGVSFLVSLFLTPLMISLAKKYNIMDRPSERKEHKMPIPLLGGMAISIASIISFIIFSKTESEFVLPLLIIGAGSISIMGLIDDIISLSAIRRLIILFIIALIVVIGCLQLYFDAQYLINRNLISIIIFSIFIMLWIVGVTNAINFSDGLDGLASYLSCVSVLSFAILFAYEGRNTFALPISLALMGAIAGFIPYNRNPAMIFMGDSGSMFIGFMLSLLSISSIRNENTLYAIIVPVYFLFVPILDMGMSVLRRIISGKSIFVPDKMHFHHQLNKKITNHILVAIILSLVQIVFSIAGILIFLNKIYIIGWIIAVIIVISLSIHTFISALRHKESIGQGYTSQNLDNFEV